MFCKTLVGEFDNSCRTDSRDDYIYHAISDLADCMNSRIKNIPLIRILQSIPFGEKMMTPFIEFLSKGKFKEIIVGCLPSN